MLGLMLLVSLFGCDQASEREAELAEAVSASPYPEGARLYERQCRGCHQHDGSGHGRAFPPLADHVPALLAAEGGREYLIKVTLFGMGGEIQVLGERYNGVMPGFRRLSDQQTAELLNHVSHAWGGDEQLGADFQLYQADEITPVREMALTPMEVWERRPSLDDQ